MATHSSNLAWAIPWIEEPGSLQSMELQKNQTQLSDENDNNEPRKEREVTQLCLTLSDPMDCSPPGSCVRGIFQARLLEWVAISFSRESSPPRDRTQVSCIAGRRFTV